jgi:hypothetical protein
MGRHREGPRIGRGSDVRPCVRGTRPLAPGGRPWTLPGCTRRAGRISWLGATPSPHGGPMAPTILLLALSAASPAAGVGRLADTYLPVPTYSSRDYSLDRFDLSAAGGPVVVFRAWNGKLVRRPRVRLTNGIVTLELGVLPPSRDYPRGEPYHRLNTYRQMEK